MGFHINYASVPKQVCAGECPRFEFLVGSALVQVETVRDGQAFTSLAPKVLPLISPAATLPAARLTPVTARPDPPEDRRYCQ